MTRKLVLASVAGIFLVLIGLVIVNALSPSPPPRPIQETRDESIALQNELIGLIPADIKAPNKLPLPGDIKLTPMSCGEDGTFRYPGTSAVRLIDGTDREAVLADLRAHLDRKGLPRKEIPTSSQPTRAMHTTATGMEIILSSIDRSDDLPMITLDVWGPCATLPEGVNQYSYKL